jgi:N-methylhydantoinase B
MPARIIETNDAAFEAVDVDTFDLDIIENALRNARHEMDAVLFRTAMSPGIREQHDEFPMIANREGKMIVGQFGACIRVFLDAYEGEIREGDVFLTNDPYSCNGAISHSPDWLVIRAIYKDGRVIGWAAMFGHMTDTGGRSPGSMPTDAQQIFEEGILIPPTKIYNSGKRNDEILTLILRNCRMPHWNRADLDALVAGCGLAARRVIEISERFGDDVYFSSLEQLLQRTRSAMRQIILSGIPEAKQYFEDYLDDDGVGMGPYKIACSMWREGEKMILDFEGTDPQSKSSVNFYCNEDMTKMHCGVFLIMLADPQILFNDGFYDLMEVRIPKGTLFNPVWPAALSCRTHGLARCMDVLAGLFGQSNPDYLCAAGFSASPHFLYSGYDERGEWFQLFHIAFGGVAAAPSGDGADGHGMWPDFTNVPSEHLEAIVPLRIDVHAVIPDSGGPGLHRGGNGVHTAYRILNEGQISIHDDRWLTHPWGVNGGLPAARSSKVIERRDGSREVLGAKCDRLDVMPGDVVHYRTWGGGGWGDPLMRPVEKVAFDVEAGLVSVEGAGRYGVVIGADTKVDPAATQTLRAKMAEQRGPIELFDRGGTLKELLARCELETGLPAPRRPTFPRWVRVAGETAVAQGM